MSLQYTMETRFGGSAADTEQNANTASITVSVAAHRKNHEKAFFLFNNLLYLPV